jgi:hypothetical protein
MDVLMRSASHLLLIGTNLGYGTVLTEACALQGCSATGDDDYYYYLMRGTIPEAAQFSPYSCYTLCFRFRGSPQHPVHEWPR